MKIFWLLIGLLAAGLGVMTFMPTKSSPAGGSRDSSVATESTSPDRDISVPASATMPESIAARTGQTDSGAEQAQVDAAGSSNTIAVAPLASASPVGSDAVLPTETGAVVPITEAESETSIATNAVEIATWEEVFASISGEELSLTMPADDSATTVPAEADGETVAEAAIAVPLAVATADAAAESAEAEGAEEAKVDAARFDLVGAGTKESPYEITWDYLTSLRETYLPREGKTEIAQHIEKLDGKYVRIGGYLQFPLATPEPKELLVMLNQWDGCCIGIPPTPYDAVEVSLARPATRGEKFAAEGSIVGKLSIDPYLVGDWLIGLYLLGDASLDVSGARPAEEIYGNSPTVGDTDALPGH